MALLALLVGQRRKTAVVVGTFDHYSLGTKAAVNTDMLVLTLDECDDIAAEKHLHLCVTVLEELVLGDLRLVPEKVHLKARMAVKKLPTVLTRT
jgi:hypothetical protein